MNKSYIPPTYSDPGEYIMDFSQFFNCVAATGNYFGMINGLKCTVFKARSGDWSYFLDDKPANQWFKEASTAMKAAVSKAFTPVIPACLKFFGLQPPITRDALLAKYRELARRTHPDLGGSYSAFKVVQANFEAASQLLEVA